ACSLFWPPSLAFCWRTRKSPDAGSLAQAWYPLAGCCSWAVVVSWVSSIAFSNMEMNMLKSGFKEWAVICKALADGKQALILRKGGIAEPDDSFTLKSSRFWLYPTYVHQQRAGIKPEALPLLEQAEAKKPPAGVIRLTHFVEVPGVYQVRELFAALILNHLH